MANVSQNLVSFHTDALDGEPLLVTKVVGVDRISTPYRFELDLVSTTSNIDIDKVVGNGAAVGMKQGVAVRGSDSRGKRTVLFNGIVSEFSQLDRRNEMAVYRAVMVPRMWRLTRNFGSRVWLELDIKSIVAQLLTDIGLNEGTDFEFRLAGSYPVREYVVQYQETDYAFMCRWLEHEGVFWFFEQTEEGEKIVFGDDTAALRPIVGADTLNYRPKSSNIGNSRAEVRETDAASDDWFAEEVIHGFTCHQHVVPKSVTLKDYNWRNPQDPLEASADVRDDIGIGKAWEYNNHYKTKEEGEDLARVRAGEIIAAERVFHGGSDCRSFQAGATCELSDHYRPDFNIPLLLTEVRHEATQVVSISTGSSQSGTYSNTFKAIPADRVYRPERKTPWPSIRGVIHGIVESSMDGKPDINEDGAYRIRMPFDEASADKENARASRYIRMIQPYAGDGYGSHFPLRAGVEVALTHVDGNPDRPLIAGAVPNKANTSPVTSSNSEKNIVSSSAGNQIEMDDTPGQEGLTMFNGAMTGLMSFRNGSAGGGGGAGGISTPTKRSRLAEVGPSRAPSGLTSELPDRKLSSRVGLFNGPLAHMSLDGGRMAPRLLDNDDDTVTSSANTDQGSGAINTAESGFFSANTSKTQADFTSALEKVANPAGTAVTVNYNDPDVDDEAADNRTLEIQDRMVNYDTHRDNAEAAREAAAEAREKAARYRQYANDSYDPDDKAYYESQAAAQDQIAIDKDAEAVTEDAAADAILTKYGKTEATLKDPPWPEMSTATSPSPTGSATDLRANAGVFYANTTRYGITLGDDVLCIFGNRGLFVEGNNTQYFSGTNTDNYQKYDTSDTSVEYGTENIKHVVTGDRASEVTIRGDDVHHYTCEGDHITGEDTFLGDNHANNHTVYGSKDGNTTTIYGNDTSGDIIVYGNTGGINHVFGNATMDSKVMGVDTSTSTKGSVSEDSKVLGYSFSKSHTMGISDSIDMGAMKNSISLTGMDNSLSISTKTSLDISASVAIAIALAIELNIAGKLTFSFGHEVKFSGGGDTEINPVVKNKIAVAENEMAALKMQASGNATDIATLHNIIGSSRRWKDRIRTFESALDTVRRLRGVRWDWKEHGTPDIGFIAEEVGAVLPEIVEFEANGVDAKGLDYTRIPAVLVEAVKEQQDIIESQQQQLDRQAAELAALREEMAAIRAMMFASGVSVS
ncbi:MAG: type VI secretion system tip protein TssI/VgrG [Planctomycetota bacterium]